VSCPNYAQLCDTKISQVRLSCFRQSLHHPAAARAPCGRVPLPPSPPESEPSEFGRANAGLAKSTGRLVSDSTGQGRQADNLNRNPRSVRGLKGSETRRPAQAPSQPCHRDGPGCRVVTVTVTVAGCGRVRFTLQNDSESGPGLAAGAADNSRVAADSICRRY
jgi:hypothetical protein